jgi:hypothetical protein
MGLDYADGQHSLYIIVDDAWDYRASRWKQFA